MNRVFNRLNYEFVNRSHGDDWDILWSIEHPLGSFDEDEDISLFAEVRERPLDEHQKMNHFPGIGILITKVSMNDNNHDSKYILPFFELPYDEDLLQEYLINNPHKELLEKNIYNRGVKIVDVKDIDNTEDSELFYQEFMSNHFLIDGHAFDFGIFVLITSFDPVRIYRYEDILLRFCPKKYHPFDRDDTEKYVVQEGCLSPYEMPTFRNKYRNHGYTIRGIFEQHIKQKGFSVVDFWTRIDDAIVSIILNSEENIINKLQKRNFSSHHFFEVVRFDFVLDVDLNPYVLEVNMSPNLTPASARFEDNALIYEQLVYNVIKIIGGGSFYEFWARFDLTDNLVSNKRNIAVNLEECVENECNINCNTTICQICPSCISKTNLFHLKESFRENQQKGNFARLFPSKTYFNNHELIANMTLNNQISIKWFKGQCEKNNEWC